MTDPVDTRKRAMEMTARILEIEESLAAGKREFFNGGKGHTHAEKSALEAERASLRYQRHLLHEQIEAERVIARAQSQSAFRAIARAQSQSAFIAVICAELESRGLGSIIEVTRRKLAEQVEQAGKDGEPQ